jgi:hypothetical protein
MGLFVLVISVASSTTWIRQRFLVVVSSRTPLNLFRPPPEPSLNALTPDQVYFNRHPETLAA